MASRTILADLGERRSGVPSALRELGADVAIEALPAGDYVVAPGEVVERKTVSDLHRSVATGRLWNQLMKLRTDADRAWLLIEGPKLDAGQLSEQGIRGAVIAVVETGIPVLWSGSPGDSAHWLLRIAIRARSARAPGVWNMRAPRRRAPAAPVRLLSQIRGISPRLGAQLLGQFGSIAAVACASESELMSINGIGAARAAALRSALSGTSREARSATEAPGAHSAFERATPGGASAACSSRAVPRHLGGSP